jgi:2-C-methyl-D-erythritol 4-phosphate cytidylyltransferase
VTGRCHAVLPAAGIGARMGGHTPKQYLQIEGVTLLEYSLRALLSCRQLDTVAVPLHPEDSRAGDIALLGDPRVRCLAGGEQRADSVLSGLQALSAEADDSDWVLVHDAARPCVSTADIERLIDTVTSSACGGILAQPVVDTVKQATGDGRVRATLDRRTLWRAQTPQMFRLGELRDALQRALREGLAVTDEASAMELAGYPVQLVSGSPSNLKVTVPEDLALAAWYLSQ